MKDFSEAGNPLIKVNLQPLVDRLAELADLGTLLMLFTILILLYLLMAERQRNARAYASQLKQAIDVVKVMTSHQSLVKDIEKSLEANATAIRLVYEQMIETRHLVDRNASLIQGQTRTPVRKRRNSTPKKKETDK